MNLRKLLLVSLVPVLFLCHAGAREIPKYNFHTLENTSYYGGIHSIAKDKVGRIWFSGHEVVCMYDGNVFVRMEDMIIGDSAANSWNFGEVKLAGKNESLFIGSNNGLILFDYDRIGFNCVFPGNIGPFDVSADGEVWMIRNGRVESFDADDISAGIKSPAAIEGFSDDVRVSSVFCTGGGRIYIAIRNSLLEYCRESNEFRTFISIGGDNTEIKDVLSCGDDVYVLTLMDGLYKCGPDGAVQRLAASRMISDSTSGTKMMYADDSGIIWVASQAGLLFIDMESGETELLRMELDRQWSLPNNSVWSIYPDMDGGVWIGTYGGKLAYCTKSSNDVMVYKAAPGGLSHPIVSCFAEDRHHNLWVGTEGGGISVYDRATGSFSYFNHGDGSGLASDFIKKIWKGEDGRMWVSSFNGGVQSYNENSRFFRKFARSNTPGPLSVYDVCKDKDGGLWLSSPDENLKYIRRGSDLVENVYFRDGTGKIVYTAAEMMFMDDNAGLYLLSRSGLMLVDTDTRQIIRRLHLGENGNMFSVNNLISFCRTMSGDVWIGTGGAGVNILYHDGRYEHFSDAAGNSLPGRTVFGIVQDEESGDVWLSTDGGLYVWSRKTGLFSKSTIDSNQNIGSYYIRAFSKTSDGEILFGGTSGFLMFNPSKITFNRQKPSVFFTGFFINNALVKPGDKDSPLKKSISVYNFDGRNETIKLNHKQANFAVQLSSDSYLNVAKNRYSYRMKGLSDEWQLLPEGQKTVSFYNMRPGKYIFEAKAANNDGLWGDRISSLHIEVSPTPFLSGWAIMFYFIICVAAVFACWHFFTNKKILEQKLEMEHIKEENLRQMTQARINFFTSISHDLKTPLTLIVDPLKQLKEHLNETSPALKYVNIIERNVVRIQRMIVQLLQFREIESQKLSFDYRPGDLVRFVGNVFSLFEGIAASKDIETEFRSEMESFYTVFDYDVMEKIVTNLISNAFKYTPSGNFVGVAISKQERSEDGKKQWMSISVMNTGSTIPEDKKEMIFDAFSRIPHTEKMMESSTGLGLAIVKELVNNSGGRIFLTSENSTVTFDVRLPFALETKAVEDNGTSYEYTASEVDNLIETSNRESEAKGVRKTNSVVVIDDDVDLRHYLELRLSSKYNVYMADNGSDGIAKVVKVNPQLVITDLMMPEADGFGVCRTLRTDLRTSHIPIIVLSGVGNKDDNRLKAMEAGASVFMDKPVDIDFLLRQADNLVSSVDKLKEMYSKKYSVEPAKVTISSLDEQLLKKAMDNIEKNMDNCDYDVETFVSDMAVGRTILYRKINNITGMSIKEFIMDVRLKRAVQYLKESEYTISEISAMTGFVNPKYFSICFRRRFGLPPSEFRKNKSE